MAKKESIIALGVLFTVIMHSSEQGAELSCATHHNTAISSI